MKKKELSCIEVKKMNDMLKTAQINHQFLIKKLASKEGKDYPGRWVAVAKNRIISDTSRNKVITKIKKIQSERGKALIVQVPKYKHLSLSF